MNPTLLAELHTSLHEDFAVEEWRLIVVRVLCLSCHGSTIVVILMHSYFLFDALVSLPCIEFNKFKGVSETGRFILPLEKKKIMWHHCDTDNWNKNSLLKRFICQKHNDLEEMPQVSKL